MKQAITGSWVYVIVLIFMVIMIAYVAISINYSRAFELSENIIKEIEMQEGFNDKSRKNIAILFKQHNTTVKHGCGNDPKNDMIYYGVNVAGSNIAENDDSKKYDYCVARSDVTISGTTKYYYSTKVFFSFSLPVLGDLFAFTIPGETSGLVYIYDDTF